MNSKFLKILSVLIFISLFFLAAWGCQAALQSSKGSILSLYEQKRFSEAIPLAEQQVAASKKEHGPNDPAVADDLSVLARLYHAVGKEAEAKRLYEQTVAILEKTKGSMDLTVADTLCDLASVLDALDDREGAVKALARANSIYDKRLPANHPDQAKTVLRMAELYASTRDYELALKGYEYAALILKEAVGENDPRFTAVFLRMADIRALMGQQEKAGELLDYIVENKKEAKGGNTLVRADALTVLAHLSREKQEYAAAAGYYEQAYEIFKSSLGSDHPRALACLNNLGLLMLFQGQLDKARPLLEQSLSQSERILGPDHPNVAVALYHAGLLQAASGKNDDAFKLFQRAMALDRILVERVLWLSSGETKTEFIQAKKRALAEILDFTAEVYPSDTARLRPLLDHWLMLKGLEDDAYRAPAIKSDSPLRTQYVAACRELAELTFSDPDAGEPRADSKRRESLVTEKTKLEATLKAQDPAFAQWRNVLEVDATKVVAALPRGAALVDFMRVQPLNLDALNHGPAWRSPKYLAFVLPASGARLHLVALGSAELVDSAIFRLKDAMENLQGLNSDHDNPAARQLYDLVFNPLASELSATRRLILCPDGKMNLIPFEILTGPTGRYLVQDYTISYLTAGRDLLGFKTAPFDFRTARLAGDPDYPIPTEDVSGQRLILKSLPGTRAEVEAARNALVPRVTTETFFGADARKTNLFTARPMDILHLAVQTYFFGAEAEHPVSPLVRSGLALSFSQGGSGLLTSADILLKAPITGTKLMVLSASDTGSGSHGEEDSAAAFQRAVMLSGVQGLVMTQWAPPDQDAREIMAAFYKAISNGQPPVEGLRSALLNQMETCQTRYGRPNPYFWGAFTYWGRP